jgi:DNA-binding cell septation regulator SpoVG
MKVISEVQINPIKPNNGLIGFASFVLYGAVYCGSVGVFTRPQGGYRLAYPTRKISNKDIGVYYPINQKIGRAIEKEVISKFEEVVSKGNDRYSSFEPRMA